jgi:large subunit ribosomal protein L9
MMATEVLLMANVTDLGSEGDVVTVADGYARNYLIPQELAAPVTEATRRRLAKIRVRRQATRKAELADARATAARFKNASVTIPVKTGEEGKMYGSVTTIDIAEALKSQGIDVDRHSLVLEHGIKELGVFDVPVKLHTDVEATVKVWVVEE